MASGQALLAFFRIASTVPGASFTSLAMFLLDTPSRCSLSTFGTSLVRFRDGPGSLPRCLPCALDLASPEFMRSLIMARSNYENTPIILNMALQAGVVVSIPC